MSLSAGGRALSTQGGIYVPCVSAVVSLGQGRHIVAIHNKKRGNREGKERLNWIRGGGSFNGTHSLLLVGLWMYFISVTSGY